jgi:hypothetical protein
MPDRTEIIYIAGRIDEALLLRGLLAERGIESVIENETLQGAIGGLPAGEATAPRVRVAADDADKARKVVQMFERQERHGPPPQELIINDEELWRDWPRCPQCDARRQTICPVCHVAGNNFLLAEYNPPAQQLSSHAAPEDTRPLLMCPTCDEAFTPQFYRRCAWCNHEFADGIETQIEHEHFEGFGARVWWAIIGMALALAAVVGYLWWLMRS